MRTIRIFQDSNNQIWKEGDTFKITLNGVLEGTHIAKLKVVGVNMLTLEINGVDNQIIDLQTIKKVETI